MKKRPRIVSIEQVYDPCLGHQELCLLDPAFSEPHSQFLSYSEHKRSNSLIRSSSSGEGSPLDLSHCPFASSHFQKSLGRLLFQLIKICPSTGRFDPVVPSGKV